ncbi:hypothetical protein WISP_140073 [Willisornis vidua]|uniref:Uncharacterized protein n=1 Tax=Willisornis vidua TaxID=1566151 RepID=A0ABQ9CMA1_9PASS|nr:hypothetical protein WISP_140073 [Willisornis vidua]
MGQLICWRAEGSAEGCGQAGLMGPGQLDEVHQAKCRVLPLGHNNLLQHYRLGQSGWRAAQWERTWRGWTTAAEHRAVCAQLAKKASGILACMRNSVASRTRGVIIPCTDTGEATPQILCPVLGLHDRKDIEVLERVQKRAVELGKGLEHKSDEEHLRELRVFSLGKRRLRGDLIGPYNYLEGGCSQRVIFNVVNFSKTKSLYRDGMAPMVKSTSRPKCFV